MSFYKLSFSSLFKDDSDELITDLTKKSVSLCHAELEKQKKNKIPWLYYHF